MLHNWAEEKLCFCPILFINTVKKMNTVKVQKIIDQPGFSKFD